MVVVDWLQTFEFVRANSERFILYSLCGCFFGISIILLTILIILYAEQRDRLEHDDDDDEQSEDGEEEQMKNLYQIPRVDLDYDILSSTRSYLPVYRYDGRNTNGFYNV